MDEWPVISALDEVIDRFRLHNGDYPARVLMDSDAYLDVMLYFAQLRRYGLILTPAQFPNKTIPKYYDVELERDPTAAAFVLRALSADALYSEEVSIASGMQSHASPQ